jgi:hypothetical protein
MPLDVEYKLSLHKGGHDARWNINKDQAKITFNLERLYTSAEKEVKKGWGFYLKPNELPPEVCIIDRFIEMLIEVEVVERVCLERAYQKHRFKGRSRCKPFCCVEKVALCMVYPEEWRRIREFIKSVEASVSSGVGS